VLPVQADTAPSRLEAVVLGAALRAAVMRHAMSGPNPLPASEQNLISHSASIPSETIVLELVRPGGCDSR
jgi:hypothetical protein